MQRGWVGEERAAYGDGISFVFLIAAAASLITLVSVILIKEVPLRTTIGKAPERVEDPATPDLTKAPTPAR